MANKSPFQEHSLDAEVNPPSRGGKVALITGMFVCLLKHFFAGLHTLDLSLALPLRI
jgi:hypothetical protein